MECNTNSSYTNLTWGSVGYGYLFIIFAVLFSIALKLKMETSLIISSLRCLVQLTVMAFILKPVLNSKEVWVPIIMACAFIILAAYETVFHQTVTRHKHMLPLVFLAILVSCGVVGLLGIVYLIRPEPFYQPQQFVPTIGLLVGNAMLGISLGSSHALKVVAKDKDRIEMFLSMGATRWETTRPIAIKSIQLGMIPIINAMSVMGIINIPGTMTGQILGGADVFDAVRYQLVTMMMVTSATCLATLISVVGLLFVILDTRHRYRGERIYEEPAWQDKLYIKYIQLPVTNQANRLLIKFKAVKNERDVMTTEVDNSFKSKS